MRARVNAKVGVRLTIRGVGRGVRCSNVRGRLGVDLDIRPCYDATRKCFS